MALAGCSLIRQGLAGGEHGARVAPALPARLPVRWSAVVDRAAWLTGRCGITATMDCLSRRMLMMLVLQALSLTTSLPSGTTTGSSSSLSSAEATDRGNNSVPSAVQQGLQAVLPQGGGSDANGTVGSAEEGERVLGHLVSLMERLSHVPYLGALSRGPLHGTRENKLREAVDELKVGARDNATLRVTLYESPQEGGEALPTMQKEFVFVHPLANESQDLKPQAGYLHAQISPQAAHEHGTGGHGERQGYRYGHWASGGRSRQEEQHGRQSADGEHRHLEDARAKVHKAQGHERAGQAERKYRVRTEIEYFEREKFKDDGHDKLKAAHQSKASTDAVREAGRFAAQGQKAHQRHIGGGYAQGSHHAVGAGYAPVHTQAHPTGGNGGGVEGGSNGFTQKDAKNREEYHHESGSQGFTDKDKGHQRAGWRERGYRIVAEKEYVDRDKHHDKAYGIDNQERGVRVNSKGKHGHNKGHDDLVKSKEHYSHGVHDSSHNEKLFANSKSTLGAGYPVKGTALYQRGPRDHLSSSTDKVAELEEGNATNAHSNGDTTGKKKVIRIRVITKRPEVASVFIKGQVANGSPGSVDSYVHAGYSDAQPDEYYAPSKDKQPKDSSDQSIENVSNDPSAGPALPSKKHFVPMEVLASFYGNVHGKSPSEDTNAKNLPFTQTIHKPAANGLGAVEDHELYNPLSPRPGLGKTEHNGDSNENFGVPAYPSLSSGGENRNYNHAISSAISEGPKPYEPRPYEGASPASDTEALRQNERGPHQNVVTSGKGWQAHLGMATKGSGDLHGRNTPRINAEKTNEPPPSVNGNIVTLGRGRAPPALQAFNKQPNVRTPTQNMYQENGAPLLTQQQPPVSYVGASGYPAEAAPHLQAPYTYPYSTDVIVPSQETSVDAGQDPSSYPVYFEGSVISPSNYRESPTSQGMHAGYTPHTINAANGYYGTDSRAVNSYDQRLYPGVQEASEIVTVGQGKKGKLKILFKMLDQKNVLPPQSTSLGSGEEPEEQVNEADVNEGNVTMNQATCQGNNCTLPSRPYTSNELAQKKEKAVSEQLAQIKKPFRKCKMGSCHGGKHQDKQQKCDTKEASNEMCLSGRHDSVDSPPYGYVENKKQAQNYGFPVANRDDRSTSEATSESDERPESQDGEQYNADTREARAMMSADAPLTLAKPVLNRAVYALETSQPDRKRIYHKKMVKIVKKDYFSQPLLLSTGGIVKDDGLWHARQSAS